MRACDKFDALLSVPHPPGEWSDEIVVDATRLAETLDDADWQLLSARWRARPTEWQVRLADALFGLTKAQPVAVLVSMLDAESAQAALAAAESLAPMEWVPPASHRAVLERLARRVSPSDRGTVTELLARLG
jgi:hypothetical protein